MKRLSEQYKKDIVPVLSQEFGYQNAMEVPKVTKVSVNIGISKALKDDKYLQVMINTLERITGQKPVKTVSRKAISGFGLRAGMVVGLAVTLRKAKMYDFLEKLTRVALPRVRDFRGIPEYSVDKDGNLAIGFREHIVFPEINPDEVEKLHGLEVSITTTAKSTAEGKRLFELMGIPFRQGKKTKKKKRRIPQRSKAADAEKELAAK
jgi:large subunit ribosomal protein L5